MKALKVCLYPKLPIFGNLIIKILKRYEIGRNRNTTSDMDLLAYFENFLHIAFYVTGNRMRDEDSFPVTFFFDQDTHSFLPKLPAPK